MLPALAAGLVLGLAAGFSPGPLLALVLSQTLRFGPAEGCKTAAAPLLTDAPIVVLAWLLASRLEGHEAWLGAVSFAGALFLGWLAVEQWRAAPLAEAPVRMNSWLKGAFVNLLSPHPWLFWMTVGAATMARALKSGWAAVGLFLGAFYLMLIGSKILVALLAARSRSLLGSAGYRTAVRGLSVLLLVFAALLAWQGARLIRYHEGS